MVGRAVECGGLENRCGGNSTGGSNPSPSARKNTNTRLGVLFFLLRWSDENHHKSNEVAWGSTMSKQKQATRSLSANECPAGILLPRESLTIRQEKYKHPFGCFIFFVAMVKEKCPCWAFYFYFVCKPNSIINGNIRDSKSG